MRPLVISLGVGALLLGAAGAQSTDTATGGPQLPVGQTFKQFEFPIYQEGVLKATLKAVQATGITLNRAETTDLVIDIYDRGTVTTTVTSPKADLYVSEQKMRTKNTVQVDRADMLATSQDCDFDLKTKKYVLRKNVRVLLKHFDVSASPKGTAAAPATASPRPASSSDSMLDSPGSAASTHVAPGPASSP